MDTGTPGTPNQSSLDAERLQGLLDRPADRPGADHARARARDPLRFAVPPLPLPLKVQRTRQILGHGQHERGHVLGDRLIEDAARVRHHRVRRGELRTHQMVHARARRVHPPRPRPIAGPGAPHRVRCEVPHKQDVRGRQQRGQRRLVGMLDPGPPGEPPEPRRRLGVEHQKGRLVFSRGRGHGCRHRGKPFRNPSPLLLGLGTLAGQLRKPSEMHGLTTLAPEPTFVNMDP